MKLFALSALFLSQLPFIVGEHAHLLNTMRTLKFNETSQHQCVTVRHLDSKTRFTIQVDGIQNQDLPVNVKLNTQNLGIDFANPQDRKLLETDTHTTSVYEGVFEANGEKTIDIYRTGTYCITFNEDAKFIGPYSAKAALIEEIFPIQIKKEIRKHGLKTIGGVAVLVGLALTYNIKSLEELTPVCQRLIQVLLVEIGYCAIVFLLESYCAGFPSVFNYLVVENYVKRSLHTLQECWKTYVIVMIYFGSGYKNLGYRVPSNIPKAGKVFLGVLTGFVLVVVSNFSARVLKRTVIINGQVSDKYLMIYNNSPSPITAVRVFMKVISFLGSGLLLLSITVVPLIYGYIIYSRFKKSGEVANAELMKKTMLYHGVVYTIITIVAGDYEHIKLFTEYAPIVILFYIWYSDRQHVALKSKYEDVEDRDEAGIPLRPMDI
ncbi:hypothetical protein SBY92_000657 [Candida maltosa Xu316]